MDSVERLVQKALGEGREAAVADCVQKLNGQQFTRPKDLQSLVQIRKPEGAAQRLQEMGISEPYALDIVAWVEAETGAGTGTATAINKDVWDRTWNAYQQTQANEKELIKAHSELEAKHNVLVLEYLRTANRTSLRGAIEALVALESLRKAGPARGVQDQINYLLQNSTTLRHTLQDVVKQLKFKEDDVIWAMRHIYHELLKEHHGYPASGGIVLNEKDFGSSNDAAAVGILLEYTGCPYVFVDRDGVQRERSIYHV